MAQKPKLSIKDIKLSTALASDLDAVIDIEERSFPTPWSRNALNAYVGNDGFKVCIHQDQIAGYVLVGMQAPTLFDRLEQLTGGFFGQNPPNEMVGHVMNIAMHPDYRGLGLGRYIFNIGLDYLKGLGAMRVELEVRINNDSAMRLYESEGFKTIKLIKGYYQNGDDAYLMGKNLSS
jgi:ribosomal-protein-alanine N-acetyltransferase